VTVRAVAATDATTEAMANASSPWPYGTERPPSPPAALHTVRLIPFFARANRGPTAMRVFLPERGPHR
jgi:DUF1680 family protein